MSCVADCVNRSDRAGMRKLPRIAGWLKRRSGNPLFAPATRLFLALTLAAACSLQIGVLRADEPFAPSREYNLQNARIELRFDFDQRSIQGQVTHTVTAVHEGVQRFDFDSVALTILSVRVNGRDARFSTDSTKLHVDLDRPSKMAEKYEVTIR